MDRSEARLDSSMASRRFFSVVEPILLFIGTSLLFHRPMLNDELNVPAQDETQGQDDEEPTPSEDSLILQTIVPPATLRYIFHRAHFQARIDLLAGERISSL
jgi:hypothetical protein